MVATDLEMIAAELSAKVSKLKFGPPVSHVYNPLDYAREIHTEYLRRYGGGPKEVLLVGMNPGPWAQTGVPFGEVAVVRDWLGFEGKIRPPVDEHPKRPVLGLACQRSEVSGRRLWGWARDTFVTPARFFERFFVGNYCPLQFLEASGRNLTPDKLKPEERQSLYQVCDQALRSSVAVLRPRIVVGVGAFAESRARTVLGEDGPRIGRILHPSPASPAANRGWAVAATRQLAELGVDLP